MNEHEFTIWKSKLRELTPDQRNATLGSLKYLGAIAVKEETSGGEDDWLLKGIFIALKKNGLMAKSTLVSLRRGRAMKQYKEAAPILLETLSPIASSTSAQSTLAYLCGIALIEWCRKYCFVKVEDKFVQSPMSAQLILANSSKLIEALEDQFPGYIQANMFHMVVASERKHVREVKRATAGKKLRVRK